MRLERLVLTAFGKFRGYELELGPGLNVIFGPNEAGKTTLQRFIQGMLYGFYRDGTRRRQKREEMDRYRPWHGDGYRGVLVYRLDHDGRRIRVEREFGDRPAVRVLDADTGEVLRFPQDPGSREVLFCREQTGLSADEFLRTACVAQNQIRIGEAGDLAARLAHLQETGREDLSLARVDRRLEEMRRPLMEQIRRLREELEPAERELDRLLRVRNEYLALTERAAALAREREALAAACRSLALRLDRIRLEEVERTLRTIREREAMLRSLDRRLAELSPYARFPAHRKEELLRLEARAQELSKQVEAAARAAREAEEREQAVAGVLAGMGVLEQLPPDAPQRARVLLQGWQRDQEELARRRAHLGARRAAVARLQAEAAALQGLGDGAEVEQELASLQARCAAAGDREPAGRVRRLRREHAAARRRAGLAVPLWGLAAAAVAAVALGPGRPGLLAGLAALAVAGLVGVRWMGEVRRLSRELVQAEADLERWQHWLAVLGARDGEEARGRLRAALVAAERARQAAEELAALERELARLEEQAAGAVGALEQLLAPALPLLAAHSGSTPTDLELRVQAFAALWQCWQELKAEWVRARDVADAETGRMRQLEADLAAVRSQMEAILAEAGVADVPAFLAGAAARQQWEEAAREREALAAGLGELAGPGGLARWEAERAELLARLEAAAAGAGAVPVLEADEHPGGEDRQALADALARHTARLREVEQEWARLQGQLDQAHGDTWDLDRRIAGVEALRSALAALEERKAAIDLARRELAAAAADMHRAFAPRLSERMAAVLPRLTAGRYRRVAVDPALNLQVEVPDLNRWVPGTHLSAGTTDQIYLALRVALVELLVPPDKERPPLILDDPFTQMDDTRLGAAVGLLAELAADYQVLLLTCHRREVEAVRAQVPEARVIFLPEVQAPGRS